MKIGKALVLYMPVLHQGYVHFLEKHRHRACFVLGREVTNEYRDLAKDIRALNPVLVLSILKALDIFHRVELGTPSVLTEIASNYADIVLPNEAVSRAIAERYFSNCTVVYDTMFLRWDKDSVPAEHPVNPDESISSDEFDRSCIETATKEAVRSPDWWRQVGALIVRDKKTVLSAYNRHVPTEHTASFEGDPRASFKKGTYTELGISLHAERGIIAEAAKRGIALEGTSLYVTTFPCPECAKLVAYAGISHLYYRDGYAVLDGERILKAQGVMITRVI